MSVRLSIHVQQAKNELSQALLDIDKRYELTPSELFFILSQEMQSLASSCIKSERSNESEVEG